MLKSQATGRQFAKRTVTIQLLSGLLAGAIALPMAGISSSLGVIMGAFAVALGTALMAWTTLGGGMRSARSIFMTFLLGVLLRWVLIATIVYLAIAKLQLNSLAVVLGLILALLVYPLANFLVDKNTKGTQ